MKLYFKIMWVLFKYSLPIFLLLVPVLALVGQFANWHQDREIIGNAYPNYSGVLVGYSSQSTTYRGVTKSKVQRSYWLIPNNFSSPMMLSITYDKTGDVSYEADTEGFWFTMFTLILIAVAFYHIWVRGYDPFNKSKQLDAQKARTSV